MKITVATLVFGELPYFRYTEAINRRYCEHRGYRFEVMRPERQVLRSPIWYKVQGAKELLAESDYVLFVDADAFFVSEAQGIERLIEEHMGDAAILFGTDRRDKNFAWSDTNANCGVFLVRNCPKGFEILEEWWNSPLQGDRKWLWAWPPEQGAFNAYVRGGPNARWIKVIYYAHMNGADGLFIRHLIGASDEQRLAFLRYEARSRSQWMQRCKQRLRRLVEKKTP